MVREAFGHYKSSADKGGDILYDLAIADIHKNHSGDYFDNDSGAYGRAHDHAYDTGKMERLNELTGSVLVSMI